MAVEGKPGAQMVINIDCFDEAKEFVVEVEKDAGDESIVVALVEVMRASPDHLTVVLAQHPGHPRDPSDIHLGRIDQSLEPVGTETFAPAKSNRSPLERVMRVLQSSSLGRWRAGDVQKILDLIGVAVDDFDVLRMTSFVMT